MPRKPKATETTSTPELPNLDEYPELDTSELENLDGAMSELGGDLPDFDVDDSGPDLPGFDDGPEIEMPQGPFDGSSGRGPELGVVLSRLETLVGSVSDYHNVVMNRLESVVTTSKVLYDGTGSRLEAMESLIQDQGKMLGKVMEMVSRLTQPAKATQPAAEGKATTQKEMPPKKPASSIKVPKGISGAELVKFLKVSPEDGRIVPGLLTALRGFKGKMDLPKFKQWLTRTQISEAAQAAIVAGYGLEAGKDITGASFA